MKFEHERALAAALEFRSMGLVALPSSSEDKKPITECAVYRTKPVPDGFYEKTFWRAQNIQLLCGAATSGTLKVVVVDLDGPEAVAAWKKLCRLKGYQFNGTWISVTGGGGKHIYFQLGPDVKECPTKTLWGLWDTLGGPLGYGCWLKHKEIKLLGDNALAVAPPSKHVQTGKEYRWLGSYGPHCYDKPAPAPDWLLAMPAIQAFPKQIDAKPYVEKPRSNQISDNDRDRVLESITAADKIDFAKRWGLRLTGKRFGNWMECHAVDREDENPSAGFDPQTGVYNDRGTGRRLSFYDMAIELGAFTNFDHAISSLKKFALVTRALG